MHGKVIIVTINIDECRRGNHCLKENSICQDYIDGYYICRYHQTSLENVSLTVIRYTIGVGQKSEKISSCEFSLY